MATTHFTNTIVVLNTLIQHITLAVFLVVHWPYPCHSVHHQWLGKRGVVHATCCHSTPFTFVHPFALLSVCHWLSLVSNTFTSERMTVPHSHVKKETVWMAHFKQGTLADAHINPL